MHPAVRRYLQRLCWFVGVAAVLYAGGTATYGAIAQKTAARHFDQQVIHTAALTVDESRGDADRDSEAGPTEGAVVGKLEVPRVGVSVMVFQGDAETTLIAGAGHVPGTPSPGGDGNVVIAAHRDTFFRKLEGVRAGDRLSVTTTRRRYDYVVESTEVVDPEDTRVMESRARNELTLITCYPFYFVGSAPRRFVVHARPRR